MQEIRAVDSDEELQASLDLVARLYPDRKLSLSEVRGFQRAVPEQQHFHAVVDDTIAGSALVVANPRLRPRRAAFASIVVDPTARRRGLGAALYERISRWARERDLEVLEGAVEASDRSSLEWTLKRGFTEIGREARVELELTLEPLAIDPPNGVTICSWADRPDIALGMYEVAVEATADIPGEEDNVVEPYEDWLAHEMQGPGDRPEATFVALAGDDVVGYAKFSLTEAQPTVAFHDLTGVKRAWRGRGVAGALKRAQIAWAKANGYERLSTANEERNEPIRKLNKRLGYKPVPGQIFVRGPMAA